MCGVFASMLAVAALAVTGAVRAQERAVTYYVQLIRSSDSDQPPQAESRRVGTKLAGTFCGLLKWKNYWEICQRKTEVIPGRARPRDDGVAEQRAGGGDRP